MSQESIPRLDKSAFWVGTFEEAEKADKEYWLSKTPDERLEALELIRRVLYYGEDEATHRVQRVIKVVPLARS